MDLNSEKRIYRFTDIELCLFAHSICSLINESIDDFLVFGITPDKISEFNDLIENLKEFPTDSFCKNKISVCTEEKNILREQVMAKIRSMALRVEAEWGNKSPKYNRLETGSLTRLNDSMLLVTAGNVHSKMGEYLPDLAAQGLTPSLLNDFANLINQFDLSLKALADAITERDERKIERLKRGNELYTMVLKYCNYGKQLYEKTSPAKYKHFLIYSESRK